MTTFAFVITVECETLAQAHQVIAERIGCDEDYGFDYTIDCPTVLGAAAPDDDWDEETIANEAWSNPQRMCVGCFNPMVTGEPDEHSPGCPTGQNGPPRY